MNTPHKISPSTVPSPEIRRAQRWNIVWVVPILALLLGAWLIYRSLSSQGPVAEVKFESADGITAGQTEVRCRSVKVGRVKDVILSKDLQSVIVHIEFIPGSEHFLRSGTKFWVVKPRFSATEISGANTLITGAYIAIDPGRQENPKQHVFAGYETPPATNHNVPGLRFHLTTDYAGSLMIGAPIYYRGFEVGRIEGRALDPSLLNVKYDAFIGEAYASLVTQNTRFWNTSGINISAGADGFKIKTPSLQAMVSGGVSFGINPDETLGEKAKDHSSFALFEDEEAARKANFTPKLKLLLLFDESVRGLSKRAPVEFRGIPVGRVADISFDLASSPGIPKIPVLIEIDPKLMCPASDCSTSTEIELITKAVADGMRASLKTASLITGSLYVDLNYSPETKGLKIAKLGEHYTIPTASSGFVQMEEKLTALLDKLQSLPLDQTFADFSLVAQDSRKTLQSLEKTVSSMGPKSTFQNELQQTLHETRASLRSVKTLTQTLNEQPNSLIFGKKKNKSATLNEP